MSQKFDWVLVRGHGNRDIGAIGFIGNDAVAIAAFYDDRDGNHDGKVSMTERVVSAISPLGLDGRAVTQVAMQARVDADIVMRNSSIGQMASRIFVDFAGNLIRDGIWTVYFRPGVKMAGQGVAKIVTDNMIKQIVIRKGFEKAAREAFDMATAL